MKDGNQGNLNFVEAVDDLQKKKSQTREIGELNIILNPIFRNSKRAKSMTINKIDLINTKQSPPKHEKKISKRENLLQKKLLSKYVTIFHQFASWKNISNTNYENAAPFEEQQADWTKISAFFKEKEAQINEEKERKEPKEINFLYDQMNFQFYMNSINRTVFIFICQLNSFILIYREFSLKRKKISLKSKPGLITLVPKTGDTYCDCFSQSLSLKMPKILSIQQSMNHQTVERTFFLKIY